MTQLAGPDPEGACSLCGLSYSRAAMTRHLSACLAREAAASKGEPVEAFHLVAEGEGSVTGTPYWIHVLVRPDTTLAAVDMFLRKTWLECCGHLSAFSLGEVRYESCPDDEYGPAGESMDDARLADVLKTGAILGYEYDFGSTTDLRVRVVGLRSAVMKGRSKIQLLAQNEPPAFSCGACGKPAVRICAVGCDGEDALVCRACAPDHECGEDMLAIIVNSPRTGVCGYPPPRKTKPARKPQQTWVSLR